MTRELAYITHVTLGKETEQLEEKFWFQKNYEISYISKIIICYEKGY
jgi:hypothetical protein